MKKYLITGASGFVAQHFLNLLEVKQKDVIVLGVDVNKPEVLVTYKFVNYQFKQLNLLDKDAVHDLLLNFEPNYILHLASYSSVAYSWKNPVEAFANNSTIFLNLVDEVRILNLKSRILSVGSSEEYGNITKEDLPVTELVEPKPNSPYAVARLSQEMMSKIYTNYYNVDIVMTRSFNHIGPGQKDIFVISSFAKKLTDIKKQVVKADKIVVGNIALVRDFVDVRDVVKAYLLLFEKGVKGQVYNICSGIGNSLESILTKMIKSLNLSIEIEIDNDLIRPNDIQKMIGSNNKLANETGWSVEYDLDRSIKDVIEYWQNK
ncbi:MAG: GDP-mannose 4,6-dehydratase [Ferruginibacter sp.]|nr:GDP-mannose 4,6-dehydratase [Ferruginibacter sp.]